MSEDNVEKGHTTEYASLLYDVFFSGPACDPSKTQQRSARLDIEPVLDLEELDHPDHHITRILEVAIKKRLLGFKGYRPLAEEKMLLSLLKLAKDGPEPSHDTSHLLAGEDQDEKCVEYIEQKLHLNILCDGFCKFMGIVSQNKFTADDFALEGTIIGNHRITVHVEYTTTISPDIASKHVSRVGDFSKFSNSQELVFCYLYQPTHKKGMPEIVTFCSQNIWDEIKEKNYSHSIKNTIYTINHDGSQPVHMMTYHNTLLINYQKKQVHKAIWSVAEKLRGGVSSPWGFKEFIIGFLFYRFLSERLSFYIENKEKEAGNTHFSYQSLDDNVAERARRMIVEEQGYFILPSELYSRVCIRAKNDPNLNETLSNIFSNIEHSARGSHSHRDFYGIFDDIHLHSKRLGQRPVVRNKKLAQILLSLQDLNIVHDNDVDYFGYGYQYLISQYAKKASKDFFFTPPEVGQLLARLVPIDQNMKKDMKKVYDPACGSGSLLLSMANRLSKHGINSEFFGQEIKFTTYNFCRMNLFLHNVGYELFDIHYGDTLAKPYYIDQAPFDMILSHLPPSTKWSSHKNPLNTSDERFVAAGVLAPPSYADWAFVMHCLAWLSAGGAACIIMYSGALRRDGAEKKIRKYVVENNLIDCVISLPDDLYFESNMPSCVVIFKKNKVNNSMYFLDGSSRFVRHSGKSKLSDQDVDFLVSAYQKRQSIPHISREVSIDELQDYDYILLPSKYVKPISKKNQYDEERNITEIEARIDWLVRHQNRLREQIARLTHPNREKLAS
ncbi:MAG: type I restriction-modification system subunit M [Proteobacteria bacterium]|nr:type I restriction-modification system subunit M [Pseudomonadota bacterium]